MYLDNIRFNPIPAGGGAFSAPPVGFCLISPKRVYASRLNFATFSFYPLRNFLQIFRHFGEVVYGTQTVCSRLFFKLM